MPTPPTPRRRAADHLPLHGWRPTLALALGVALVDWGTKAAVAATIPVGELREVVDGRVALWHVKNPAMMLGLWEGLPLDARKALALVAGIAALVIMVQVVGRAHRLSRRHRPWAWLFSGLVLGGMAGNLGERALHWHVTDFLSFRWGAYWLPPGNVADVALFLSIPLVLPIVVFELRARARRRARGLRALPRPAEGSAGS